MNYKQFQNNKKSKDVFLKYLIAKMDRSDLSEKERKLMHELQNSHNERDFENKLSSVEEVCEIMCRENPHLKGLKLRADGFESMYYKK